MKLKSKMNAKPIIILSLLSIIGLGACATSEPTVPNWGHHSNSDGPLGHHEKGVQHIEKPIFIEKPPIVEYAPPPAPTIAKNYNQVSNLFGCTGAFSLQAENGQILATGRAYNAPEGLYIIDKNGVKTGKIINNTGTQSLIFSPDCGCKNIGNVEVETKFSGHTHSGMTCN